MEATKFLVSIVVSDVPIKLASEQLPMPIDQCCCQFWSEKLPLRRAAVTVET